MAPDTLEPPPDVEPKHRPVSLADLDRRLPAAEPDSARWMRELDVALLGIGMLARGVAYGAIYAVTTRWDFGPSMLAGMLAGDLVGSVGSLPWDWRRRGAVAVVELIAVALFATWWWTRSDGVAERPDYQAVAVLAAFGAFIARGSAQATHLFGAAGERD